jgi:hypothetical protein
MQPGEWIIVGNAQKHAGNVPKLVKKWPQQSKKQLTYMPSGEEMPISKIL